MVYSDGIQYIARGWWYISSICPCYVYFLNLPSNSMFRYKRCLRERMSLGETGCRKWSTKSWTVTRRFERRNPLHSASEFLPLFPLTCVSVTVPYDAKQKHSYISRIYSRSEILCIRNHKIITSTVLAIPRVVMGSWAHAEMQHRGIKCQWSQQPFQLI